MQQSRNIYNNMTSGHPGSNPPQTFICQYCGNKFERVVVRNSELKYLFCSAICRNKSRSKPHKYAPCPTCGKLVRIRSLGKKGKTKFCSRQCTGIGNVGKEPPNKISDEIREIVKRRYPVEGPDNLITELGISIDAIRRIAYSEGTILEKDTFLKRQQETNGYRMRIDNPMKNAVVREKVSKFWQEHPEKKAEITFARLEKTRNLRKLRTKPELLLYKILENLPISFIPQAVIKPQFMVDALINDHLIIQVDGEYWHGHPRFEPLTERQVAQRKRDISQDKYLHTCGYTVIRLWERDIKENIIADIVNQYLADAQA